jgi:hypothetical protein
MNNEQQMTWKEEVVAWFEVLTQNFRGETENQIFPPSASFRVDILCMNHTEIEAVYMIEMCSTHGDLVW